MARVPLQQFLREYGLLCLGASNMTYVPGSIVDREKKFRNIGYLKNVLEGTENEWPTELVEGHIPDSVEWGKSLKGRASLSIPGVIDIGGGLSEVAGGKFHITGVKTRVLEGQNLSAIRLQLAVYQWLQEWRALPQGPERNLQQRLWRSIRGTLVVQSTWFAAEYSLDFDASGGADIKAETEGNVNVGAGADYEWTTRTRLKVTGNDRVPFAMRWWRIKG
jgi:hypothetical protein